MSLAVAARGLVHIYRPAGFDVVALAGVDLDIHHGESVALTGPSGSGKSTLLALLAGLLVPTAGRLTVVGRDLVAAGDDERRRLRGQDVGVVLQGSVRNLVPYLSVEQNVLFAQKGAPVAPPPAREVLSAVGLTVRGRNRLRPDELTPAERGRLALAVGIARGPRLLLADEPTAGLDQRAAGEVTDALDAVARSGTTVVAVTHDTLLGARLGRTVTIRDGRVGAEGRHGADYSVIGRDGSVHLPPDVLRQVPAGTLVTVERRDDGTILLVPAPHHTRNQVGEVDQ